MGARSQLARLGWTAYLARHLRGQARFPFRSSAEIRRVQTARVRAMARHARESVPFYCEAFDRLGLSPEDVQTPDDLALLPILEREDLQLRLEDLTSRLHPPHRCLRLRSGGSTGAPRTVYHNPAALFQNAAHGERERSILADAVGLAAGYREAVISSPLGTAEEVQTFVRRRLLLPARLGVQRAYFSILDPPEENARLLHAFRPHVIQSYGSYLGALFQHIDESGAPFTRPRIVMYSSDPLPEAARRLITESFGIPVISTYQAVEAFKIGFTCEAGGDLHVNVDLYPVRVVDDDGRPVPDGESGSVIVSNLVNRGTVLLNYRLGDRAAFRPGPCPCGRNLPRLTLPQGRDDEWVVLPGGGRVHAQSIRTLFTLVPGVLQYQVAQSGPSRFRVAAVTAANCDRARVGERLRRNFAGRFGPDVMIEIDYVDAIPRTPGGKMQVFIPLVPLGGS